MSNPEDISIELAPELNTALGDHQLGNLYLWLEPNGGARTGAVVRTDLSSEQIARFKAWAATAIDQALANRDPIANGWFASSVDPSAYYMTATLRSLPEL